MNSIAALKALRHPKANISAAPSNLGHLSLGYKDDLQPAAALLDNRILKKQYGRVFLDSLPNYARTTDINDVERFFGAGEP